jgi:hypothetical protein
MEVRGKGVTISRSRNITTGTSASEKACDKSRGHKKSQPGNANEDKTDVDTPSMTHCGEEKLSMSSGT